MSELSKDYGGLKPPYQPGDIIGVRETWLKNHRPTGWPWHYYVDDDVFTDKDYDLKGVPDLATTFDCAAFTVAEMGQVLRGDAPYWIEIWGEWGYKKNGQAVGYERQAIAYADKLIYLLENKLITAQEVNDRLKG